MSASIWGLIVAALLAITGVYIVRREIGGRPLSDRIRKDDPALRGPRARLQDTKAKR